MQARGNGGKVGKRFWFSAVCQKSGTEQRHALYEFGNSAIRLTRIIRYASAAAT